MKFCTSCGSEMPKNGLYCASCGNEMKNAASPVQNRPHVAQTPTHETAPAPNGRANKGGGNFKWIGIALMTAIVIGAGAFFALSTIFSPQKALEDINEQFINENKLEFYNSFTIPSDTVGSEEEFYAAMKQADWSKMYTNILSALDTDNVPVEIKDSNGDRILLATVTKEFGIFKKLNLAYSPEELVLTVADKKTAVTIGGQELLAVAENEKFNVPIIPGKYKVDVVNGDNSKQDIVHIEPNKDNKFAIATLAAAETAEAPEKSEAAVTAKQPQQQTVPKVEKKPALTMDSYSNINSIYSFFSNYRDDYEAALYYIEPSYIQSYFSNNSLYNEFVKFINGHYSIPGYDYTFGSNDITKMEPIDANSFYVYTYETFHFYSDEDGMYYYERSKRYTVAHNGGNFKFTAIKTLDTKKYKQ